MFIILLFKLVLHLKENPTSIACHSGCSLLCFIFYSVNFWYFISCVIFFQTSLFTPPKVQNLCFSTYIFSCSSHDMTHYQPKYNFSIILSCGAGQFWFCCGYCVCKYLTNYMYLSHNLTKNCFTARKPFLGAYIFISMSEPFSL